MLVDRLEVLLASGDEGLVGQLGQAADHTGDHLADTVLDEARPPVRLLHDGDLIDALHQLVDLRGHRMLDDLEQRARVDLERCDSVAPTWRVPRPRWLCVATGTTSRIRSTSSSLKPSSSSATRAPAATSSCAHGQAVMPCAATPTTRRVPRSEATASPCSV